MPAMIEINVEGRADAEALMQRLDPYHPDIANVARKQWRVRAEAPGREGESTSRALAAIEETLAERHLDGTAVRVNGQLYNPPSPYRRPSAMDARPRASSVRAPAGARRASARSVSELIELTRERSRRPLPHPAIDLSPGELESRVASSRGYDDVEQGDDADFVRFVEGAGGVNAIATYTHIVGKAGGTISVEEQYEEGGKTRIGTRNLAFRKNRFVYDPAHPDSRDLGFLTAMR